jgi:hypothetical protein
MRWGEPILPTAIAAFFAVTVCLSGMALADSADSGCMSVSNALEQSNDSSVELFLAATSDESGVVSRLSCVNGSVERIALRAEPGQRAEVALVLANAGFDPALISSAMAMDAAWSSEWAHLEILQGEVPAGGVLPISLVVSVPHDFVPGSRHEQRFDLVDEGGTTLAVNITLEVIEEQPMFRDGFDVDPVLGQFSYQQDPVFNPGS